MALNGLENKEKLIKYRYILIAILFIIIVLLIIFLFIVKNSNNEENNNNEDDLNTVANKEQEEELMVIALDKNKESEESKEKLKQEEENATGVIYLTFDDGPTSDSTPQILDILKRKDVKATFFVLHYSEENAKYIKREQSDGHTIALHGYTHTYSEVYQSADTCIQNFRKIQEQVKQTTGITSNIIRFPGGSSNTISRKYCQGVMTELSQRVIDEGFRYFDWNVDSDDAGRARTSDDIFSNVTSGIKAHRNNVVLMHDFGGNHKTIGALESIIDYGLENGYVFRRITDETPMVTHSVNN